jgi:SSS family solute:Na+ symporter
MSYPALAQVVLPGFLKGLFFVGMLASIMASLESLTFISAVTIGKDILFSFFHKNDSAVDAKSRIMRYSHIGIFVTAAISIAITLLVPSVIQIWYDLGAVFIPGLLIPLLSSYYPKLQVSPRYIFLSMTSGWVTSLFWLFSGMAGHDTLSSSYLFNIQPMYPGLFLSAVFYSIGFAKKAKEASEVSGISSIAEEK